MEGVVVELAVAIVSFLVVAWAVMAGAALFLLALPYLLLVVAVLSGFALAKGAVMPDAEGVWMGVCLLSGLIGAMWTYSRHRKGM